MIAVHEQAATTNVQRRATRPRTPNRNGPVTTTFFDMEAMTVAQALVRSGQSIAVRDGYILVHNGKKVPAWATTKN